VAFFFFSSFSNNPCNSKLELKEIKESSFLVEIEASGQFSAELLYIENGEYFTQEKKSGNGNSQLEFLNIEEGKVYKILVKYSNAEPLCSTRQLSGLTL
jgi:hypothetical protein